jgi:signal peptidase II
VTDHWPTFNVADIAICVGVALMAVDMLTSRRGKKPVEADVAIEPVVATEPALVTAEPTAPPAADAAAAGESSAHTADGAPAPPDATSAPPPRD